MPKRKVEWGTDTNGKKVLVAFEFGDNGKVDVWTFRHDSLPKSFVDDMFQMWRKGSYVNFDDCGGHHDHIVWDLTVSPTMPAYIRVNQPKVINDEAKREFANKGSIKVADVLSVEIRALERRIGHKYDKQLWEQARHFSQKINKLKENLGTWGKGKLLPQDAHKLRGQLNKVFDKLSALREKEQKEYESECLSNYSRLKPMVDNIQNVVQTTTDWRATREELRRVQGEMKGKKLKKQQRDELWKKINAAFDKLSQRQTADRKAYENECNKNFSSLKTQADSAVSRAYNSEDLKNARESLKQVQASVKGKKLKKDQRETIWKRIQEGFTRLKSRQDAKQAKYERECNENYSHCSALVDKARSLADHSSDFRDAREQIKGWRQEIFNTKPMKREKKSELIDRITRARDRLNERSQEDYERRKREREEKQRQWRERMREQISKLKDAMGRIETSIARDKDSLSYQHGKLSSVRPGRREHEIRSSITEKINSIEARIRSKESRLADMTKSLREKEDKLN